MTKASKPSRCFIARAADSSSKSAHLSGDSITPSSETRVDSISLRIAPPRSRGPVVCLTSSSLLSRLGFRRTTNGPSRNRTRRRRKLGNVEQLQPPLVGHALGRAAGEGDGALVTGARRRRFLGTPL